MSKNKAEVAHVNVHKLSGLLTVSLTERQSLYHKQYCEISHVLVFSRSSYQAASSNDFIT